MNLITEQELQATVIEVLEAAGWRVFHVSDSRKEVRDGETYRLVGDPQAAGYPDLSASRSGDALWAELKSQRGKLEPEQVEWLDDLPPHRACVWQPRDLDRAIAVAGSGHPAEGATCWACHRDEILKRVGVKRRSRGEARPDHRRRKRAE